MVATFQGGAGVVDGVSVDGVSGNGGDGAHTDTLQPLGMVVVAIATVTRVAWGRVHAHTTFAHLVSEQLALVHICGKDGKRLANTKRDG